MEHMKHKYSKRVYQIMTDHGPDHPYLSCFPFVRYVTTGTMERFFTKCSGPVQDSSIRVEQEIGWEKRQLRREEPIVVKAPSPISRPKAKPEKSHRNRREPKEPTGEYTLTDLCGELGMSPAKARKLLRSHEKKSPDGGWKWPSKEEAKSIKRFLRKF